MKVIGISGSPRKGGNSEILLDEALKGARSAGASIEKIILNDLDFKACQECGGCDESGSCIIDDDMRLVYKKIAQADRIVIASPIFFGSVTAQLKAMIDRFQSLWVKKYVLKKPASPRKKRKGIFLCVSGSDKEGFFKNARSLVRIFFNTLDIVYFGDLFCGSVDKKSDIKKRIAVLRKAFELGAALAHKA